ncbi:MAG: polymer-forming cytoskeletal protein [Candidatus Dormibacteraeota bacterium]|nr:polymer-forming cytoskeletal protein [Candidatus Dormibacteraeota bacterium]
MPGAEIRPVTPFPSTGGEEPPLTVLSEGDAFNGRLEMRGDGHVMGSFEGEIDCGGELLVGPDARVGANIRAVNVTISGRVAGNLVARGRLKITAMGQLKGDADVATLVVQEGGVHFGTLRVHPEGVPEKATDAGPVDGTDQAVAAANSQARAPSQSGSGASSRPLTGSVDRVKRLWGELF